MNEKVKVVKLRIHMMQLVPLLLQSFLAYQHPVQGIFSTIAFRFINSTFKLVAYPALLPQHRWLRLFFLLGLDPETHIVSSQDRSIRVKLTHS